MGAKIVHTDDVNVYDGANERCRLDAAFVPQNYDNGAEFIEDTTNDVGLMPEGGHVVSAAHPTVRIAVAKPGYKSSAVKVSIAWDGDSGTLGVKSFYMVKK